MTGKRGAKRGRKSQELEPGMMRVSEVVARLGVNRNTVYRAVAAGEIPSTRVGGLILIPSSWVRETLNPRQ